MSEEDVVVPPVADDDEAAIVAEVEQLAADPPTAKDKVTQALIAAKKDLRAANRKVKELEPVAASAAQVRQQLDQAMPIINAVVADPRLRAEAMRIANGTRASSDRTDQPTPDEDPDAAGYAEDMGFFLADQQTPDIARARRVLDRLDQRHGKQTNAQIQPLARRMLGSQAEQNVQQAIGQTDEDGTPLASRESILETVKMMGGDSSPLLANPQVVDLLINNAIGLDRRKGRTPKPVDEPIYLERNGGGGRREPILDADLKASFTRLNIDEKQGTAAIERLNAGAIGRKGIALGVK